jgi:hypothetical protein
MAILLISAQDLSSYDYRCEPPSPQLPGPFVHARPPYSSSHGSTTTFPQPLWLSFLLEFSRLLALTAV